MHGGMFLCFLHTKSFPFGYNRQLHFHIICEYTVSSFSVVWYDTSSSISMCGYLVSKYITSNRRVQFSCDVSFWEFIRGILCNNGSLFISVKLQLSLHMVKCVYSFNIVISGSKNLAETFSFIFSHGVYLFCHRSCDLVTTECKQSPHGS